MVVVVKEGEGEGEEGGDWVTVTLLELECVGEPFELLVGVPPVAHTVIEAVGV